MKTRYEIRSPSLDGIMIDFNDEWDARKWWDENVRNAPTSDTRHGRVIVRHTWETHAEAETARLDFMISNGSIAKFSAACLALPNEHFSDSSEWPKAARLAIDNARGVPPDEVVVIWPK